MAYVEYTFDNERQLKSNSQEVLDKTALKLGFTTARKSMTIKIRMRKGVGHQSWNSPKSIVDSEELFRWLTGGFRAGTKHKRIRGRPVLDQYIQLYSEDIAVMCAMAFRKSGTIKDKCYRAGVMILDDLKHKIYSGSFNLAPNVGKYAKRKWGAGYGDIPLVATKRLMETLEVVVE